MGLTLTTKTNTIFGNKRIMIVTADFDSSYPTGGEGLSADNLGLAAIELVVPTPKSGYVFEYDYSNSKLKAYYADYDAAADGALIEVAATTDLSGVTDVHIQVIGH